MKAKLGVVIGLLGLTGCAAHPLSMEQVQQFKPGQTTERDLVQRLGPPTHRAVGASGSVELAWTERESGRGREWNARSIAAVTDRTGRVVSASYAGSGVAHPSGPMVPDLEVVPLNSDGSWTAVKNGKIVVRISVAYNSVNLVGFSGPFKTRITFFRQAGGDLVVEHQTTPGLTSGTSPPDYSVPDYNPSNNVAFGGAVG
jgi:hypothetical protein